MIHCSRCRHYFLLRSQVLEVTSPVLKTPFNPEMETLNHHRALDANADIMDEVNALISSRLENVDTFFLLFSVSIMACWYGILSQPLTFLLFVPLILCSLVYVGFSGIFDASWICHALCWFYPFHQRAEYLTEEYV